MFDDDLDLEAIEELDVDVLSLDAPSEGDLAGLDEVDVEAAFRAARRLRTGTFEVVDLGD